MSSKTGDINRRGELCLCHSCPVPGSILFVPLFQCWPSRPRRSARTPRAAGGRVSAKGTEGRDRGDRGQVGVEEVEAEDSMRPGAEEEGPEMDTGSNSGRSKMLRGFLS